MDLLKWFRRPEKVVAPHRKSSLFSTEGDVPSLDPFAWGNSLARAIQRTPDDFVISQSDGALVAMDAAKPKSTNAIGSYAMDAPSAGNPLSMKPLISPYESIPFAQLCWYTNQTFIGYQICALIAQHWLVDKICTMPARDAMRHGYEIATEEDAGIDDDDKKAKVIAYIKKRDKQMGIKSQAVEFIRFNRIFGIRIAMFNIDTDDKDFYVKPFNIDGVKPGSYKGISQIDPYWITPELDFEAAANPANMRFYEPTWWRINGKRVHYTHLVLIRNGEVADMLKPTYLYGGVSITQKICERVYAAERTANEAPQLALTKRTTVMKMDITTVMANQGKFENLMNFFAQSRDNYGVKTIGMDDTAEQFDTTLADFSETIITQYEIACAAGDAPVSKVMGTSPKGGLGANGDYEADSYHEFLETLQMNDAQPLIERHHLLLIKSEVLPKFGVLFEPVIVWEPVDTPSAKEQAEINFIKSGTTKNIADTGAIDGQDIRTMLIADKDSGFNQLDDVVPGGPGDPDFIPVTQRRETKKEGEVGGEDA